MTKNDTTYHETAPLVRPGMYDGQMIDVRAEIERDYRIVRDARGLLRYVTVRARAVIVTRDRALPQAAAAPIRDAKPWRRTVAAARDDVRHLDAHAGALAWSTAVRS